LIWSVVAGEFGQLKEIREDWDISDIFEAIKIMEARKSANENT
jgi:hypothetical protein